ncbi:hypothetical protein E6C67_11720 [Azospirillum sp. TSA2s]|uniref:hypothetical protein n=1 Tax=Azospirillum sp. TSA2s TaxID=709810 RepID=UPI0010AAD7F4|nr:hypothetical protein [Azospirillum sp. TSA2s]QCG94568.1 hypothetical protein E6C67_11720 [Azospirillum sp. TSA2s]
MLTEADAHPIGFPVRRFTKRRIASYIHLLAGAATRGNAEQERSFPIAAGQTPRPAQPVVQPAPQPEPGPAGKQSVQRAERNAGELPDGALQIPMKPAGYSDLKAATVPN